jgi:SAM-dependent methyltransferase
MNSFIRSTHCLACDRAQLFEVLQLGNHSPVNSLTVDNEERERFPLTLIACSYCGHAQQDYLVSPEILFADYTYASSTSNLLNEYSRTFAKVIAEVFDHDVNVLEIASNDGTLLKFLAENHLSVTGIDPAEEMVLRSVQQGLNATVGFWPKDVANLEVQDFDLIVGQNVLAHTPDPFSFMRGVSNHLKSSGVAIFQTSQADMLSRNEFDTIYHEHFSFFCENSARELGISTGFTNLETFYSPIHGNSAIYCFSKDEIGEQHSRSLKERFTKEYPEENLETQFSELRRSRTENDWIKFGANAQKILNEMKFVVSEYSSAKFRTICIGSSAKGITAIKSAGVGVDVILDSARDKIGKWIPGMEIQIHDLNEFKVSDTDFYIFTAWNFKHELALKLISRGASLDSQAMFFFPKVHLVRLGDIVSLA